MGLLAPNSMMLCCNFVKCRYADCRHAECHGAPDRKFQFLDGLSLRGKETKLLVQICNLTNFGYFYGFVNFKNFIFFIKNCEQKINKTGTMFMKLHILSFSLLSKKLGLFSRHYIIWPKVIWPNVFSPTHNLNINRLKYQNLGSIKFGVDLLSLLQARSFYK